MRVGMPQPIELAPEKPMGHGLATEQIERLRHGGTLVVYRMRSRCRECGESWTWFKYAQSKVRQYLYLRCASCAAAEHNREQSNRARMLRETGVTGLKN